MGGPIPQLHGGEGLPRLESARRGQEAPGPVPTLCLRQRDWRFGPGTRERRAREGCHRDAHTRRSFLCIYGIYSNCFSGEKAPPLGGSLLLGSEFAAGGLPWGQGPRATSIGHLCGLAPHP